MDYCDGLTWASCLALQVSLRDPMRNGAEDHELREIISAAVCSCCYYQDSEFYYDDLEKI